MIIVGDVHIKRIEPYLSSTCKFFEWLLQDYRNDTIVFLGDIYDSSTPHGDVSDYIAYYFKQFKEVHLLTGNHDYSKPKGNSLLQLRQHDNIFVYNTVTEVKIGKRNCLMLPFKYSNMKEEYEELNNTYNFVFTHIVPSDYAFGEEGISLNLKGSIYVHGHSHMQKDFIDKNEDKHIILGVPMPTRHLEEQQEHRILNINTENTITEIKVPQYFTYETVEYGEEPVSKYNILNIKNAPSFNDVNDMYKDSFIREEGTTIKIEDEDYDVNDIMNMLDETKKSFIEFSKKMEIQKEYVNCCLEFL